MKPHKPANDVKLTGVARASLGELLEDYRDFLRLRGAEEWPKEHRYTKRLRQLNRQPGANYETFKKGIEHPDPLIAANVMIGLIKLTSYLLDQQLRRLEQDFLKQGGLRERMTRARLSKQVSELSHLRPPGRQKRKTSLRRPNAAHQKRKTGQATAFLRTRMRNMSGHEMASACGCLLNAL